MPYWNKLEEMKEVSDYPDFFRDEFIRRDQAKGIERKRKKSSRFICPDCQKECQQDDADFTLDCKNLYTTGGYRSDGVSNHNQCLCYSREHGIRLDAIETELLFRHRAKNRPHGLKKYLLELLEYQLSLKYQPEWYQEKIKRILNAYKKK